MGQVQGFSAEHVSSLGVTPCEGLAAMGAQEGVATRPRPGPEKASQGERS